MKLYLDDVRDTPKGFDLRACTAQEAITMLREHDITFISFDHDLGPVEAGTGYDVAKWIEQAAYLTGFVVPEYVIHSANPVGRDNIEAAMSNAVRYYA